MTPYLAAIITVAALAAIRVAVSWRGRRAGRRTDSPAASALPGLGLNDHAEA